MLTRREFSAGVSALSLSLLGVTTPSRADEPSLAAIGQRKGIEIGSAFHGSRQSPKYLDILRKHCEVITPEWQLKPAILKKTANGPYTWWHADRIAEFCAANGKKLHGHTLFWHQQPIRWAESDVFDEVKIRYGGFIRDVLMRYPQAVSWDVFNEIIEEKARFRNELLIQKHGLKFVDYCFRIANELAPDARLVINDYNLECLGSWCDSKRANMLSVLRQLRSMGTPLHAVGIQGHISTKWPSSPRKTLRFVRQIEDLGLDVFFSEVDVNDSQLPSTAARRDAEVAERYGEFLSTVLQSKSVKRVVFWGISDYDNWIVRGEASWEQRKDGAARPALFDAANDPKPAFFAVAKALDEAPVRVVLLTVSEAQRLLVDNGFDPGPVDGQWGRRSLSALNELRISRGLAAASELDLESQKLILSLGQ